MQPFQRAATALRCMALEAEYAAPGTPYWHCPVRLICPVGPSLPCVRTVNGKTHPPSTESFEGINRVDMEGVPVVFCKKSSPKACGCGNVPRSWRVLRAPGGLWEAFSRYPGTPPTPQRELWQKTRGIRFSVYGVSPVSVAKTHRSLGLWKPKDVSPPRLPQINICY